MAVAAGDTDMGLSQSEAGHGVIKLDTCPGRSVMAVGAIVPQPPLVGVILSMAADAAGRSRLQIIEGARHGMACLALERRMRRHKWESGGRMIEVRAE
jgi:hypothetical protein